MGEGRGRKHKEVGPIPGAGALFYMGRTSLNFRLNQSSVVHSFVGRFVSGSVVLGLSFDSCVRRAVGSVMCSFVRSMLWASYLFCG